MSDAWLKDTLETDSTDDDLRVVQLHLFGSVRTEIQNNNRRILFFPFYI